MKIETLMADILIRARAVGKQSANSITDKKQKEVFLFGYETALMQVQLDLGMAFKRMKPEAKKMELME